VRARGSPSPEQPPSAVSTRTRPGRLGARPSSSTSISITAIAALAILLRDPALDVRAMLVDNRSRPLRAGLRNVSYLLRQLGVSDIPVACGREDAGPDGRPFPADWRIGPDTAWGIDIPPQIGTGIPDDAATLLRRVLDASKEPVTIVALGPWTNLEDPSRRIRHSRPGRRHPRDGGRRRCPGKRHRLVSHRRRLGGRRRRSSAVAAVMAALGRRRPARRPTTFPSRPTRRPLEPDHRGRRRPDLRAARPRRVG
jgi:hypothetical protein